MHSAARDGPTFGELLETFKGYVESIRIAKLGGIIQHRNVEDLNSVIPSMLPNTLTMLMLMRQSKVLERVYAEFVCVALVLQRKTRGKGYVRMTRAKDL
jgi:hypothetical protein